MAKEEKQRALYMDDESYKLACENAYKFNCSFSKYMNELNKQFSIKKEVLIVKNK